MWGVANISVCTDWLVEMEPDAKKINPRLAKVEISINSEKISEWTQCQCCRVYLDLEMVEQCVLPGIGKNNWQFVFVSVYTLPCLICVYSINQVE